MLEIVALWFICGKIGEMVRAGIWLNLFGTAWIVVAVWLLGSFAFGPAPMFGGG